MANNTFSVLFYLNAGRKDTDGKSPIYARITVNNQRFAFSTKLKVAASSWVTSKGRTTGRCQELRNINIAIDDILSRLNAIYHIELTQHNFVSIETIKADFFCNKARATTLITIMEQCNEIQKKLVGVSIVRSTYLHYERTKVHIQRFIKSRYGVNDISIINVTSDFIRDLDIYLKTECNIGINTAGKYMKIVKHTIQYAIGKGCLDKDPFLGFRIRFAPVDRGYLTRDEIDAIMNKHLVCERLRVVRDLFVFSCYTGLAYIDVEQLTEENIKPGLDGKQWIVKRRQKTNVESNVMLLDIPMAIIEKYRGTTSNGRLFPIPSNQKTNAYLKELADICGIDKRLTFHIARHTFATTITLANGVPIETISKMLGHTNIRTTQIYARITNDKISRDMQALAQKIGNINNHY